MSKDCHYSFKKSLLTAALFIWPTAASYAQSVTLTGSNAMFSNGCNSVSSVPTTCATQTYTTTIPTPTPNWVLPNIYSSGLIVGSNLTYAPGGPAANGSLTLLNGGKGTGAYLYLGYEPNAHGEMQISGSGSAWTASSAGIVGHYGTGNLTITDGGLYKQTNPDHFYIGYAAGSNGTVIVDGVSADGTRSSLDVLNRVVVAGSGTGVLHITRGGLVDAGYSVFIGANPLTNGTVYVDGVDAATGIRSTLTAKNNNLQVGDEGVGVLNITNGALVKLPNYGVIGWLTSGEGIVNVDGVDAATGLRSTIEIGETGVGVFGVAGAGKGIMNVTNGALAIAHNPFMIGRDAGGNGTVTVSGAGSEVIAHLTAVVGTNSVGVLTLDQGGTFSANLLELGTNLAGSGTVNIGTGANAGVLATTEVRGGLGRAAVNFNHVDNIVFAPQITGTTAVNKLGSGTTTLNAANSYTGLTTVTAGVLSAALANSLSPNSQFIVQSGGTLALNGFSHTLAGLENAGVVRLAALNGTVTPGTVLTVAQNYQGAGGSVQLATALGGDHSTTDQLVVQGNTAGNSKLVVKNAGGMGAQTTEGIQVVVVNGISAGAFSLVGDYTASNGQGAVVGGAYAYQLHQGNASGTEAKGWYLRSELAPTTPPVAPPGPLYQPGVPLYESYGQILLGLNSLPTLQQRVGTRLTNQTAPASSATADPVTLIEQQGSWARVEAWHTKIDPSNSTSNSHYDYDALKIQVGHDFLLHQASSSKLFAGINAYYTNGQSGVNSPFGNGDISTNGYGLGGSLTWYGDNGVYLDTQASVTWYSSSLYSQTASRNLVNDNNGLGYAFSAELGKRVVLDDRWSITPQFQLQYSNVSFDSFTDVFGAQVKNQRADSLLARLGVNVAYQQLQRDVHGKLDRGVVYGLANLYNEFLDGSKVNVSGVDLVSQNSRLWAGVGFGGAYYWNDGQYALYGEASINTSLQNFGDSYSMKGTVGFRARW